MSFHGCLQSLRSTLATGRGQRNHRRRGSPRAGTHRPHLEVLEDRLVLSFTPGNVYFDGFYPGPAVTTHSEADGDFTGDGISDYMYMVPWNPGVYLQAGRAAGTFEREVLTGIPPGASLAAADFNGDGLLDVVTVSSYVASGTGEVDDGPMAMVLLGRGDGTFVGQGYFGVGLEGAYGMDTSDFDGDGRPDLEVAGTAFRDMPMTTTVQINRGDWPSVVPSLRINDATVTEGDAGTVAATFTVTLPTAWTRTITVDYATRDATATAGSDYQAASGTLTFAPGETSKTVTVLVNGDRLPEPNETFYVVLNNPTNATVGGGYGVGTIVDDGRRVSIIPAMSRSEGNTGQAPLAFAVTLSSASNVPVTVAWATADGTATAGGDYQAASGTLTFAPGQTSKTVSVLVKGDRIPEPNETFVVNLSSPTNAALVAGQGVGTIVDDEPRISIGDVSKKEGKNGQTTLFTFTVTLSAAYDQPVTMSFLTVDDTARTSDSHYVARTGALTFRPNQPLTQTITIEVKGDGKREADEAFYLDLFGNSSNSLFTKKRGIGTVRNDD